MVGGKRNAIFIRGENRLVLSLLKRATIILYLNLTLHKTDLYASDYGELYLYKMHVESSAPEPTGQQPNKERKCNNEYQQ